MQLHERSFGGFRLSPKPPTRWDEGSSSRCSRRKREAQSCQPILTAVQQYSLTPTASTNRKSTKTIKSTRLTIGRRTRIIQSKKIPDKKGPFSTGGIRLYKKWPNQFSHVTKHPTVVSDNYFRGETFYCAYIVNTPPSAVTSFHE